MHAPIEMIVAAFESEGKADEALKALRDLEREGVIGIVNAAVMVNGADGKPRLRETGDVRAPGGALFGAIVGGLVGLLGGPAGVIVGAAAGAATGGLTARLVDMGFSDEHLKEIQSGLPAGSSAILALIRHDWVDRVIEELEAMQGRLFRRAIKEELLSQLPPAVEEKEAQPPEAAKDETADKDA